MYNQNVAEIIFVIIPELRPKSRSFAFIAPRTPSGTCIDGGTDGARASETRAPSVFWETGPGACDLNKPGPKIGARRGKPRKARSNVFRPGSCANYADLGDLRTENTGPSATCSIGSRRVVRPHRNAFHLYMRIFKRKCATAERTLSRAVHDPI
jgi:hypothetical protein